MSLNPPPPRLSSLTSEHDHKMTSQVWSGWFRSVWKVLGGTTYTGTIPLAKLTGGGANGSITLVNGIVKSVVPPT